MLPALGKGSVDIPGALAVLKQHGYKGPITLEIEGVEGVERSEAQIKQDIADSEKYIRSLGKFDELRRQASRGVYPRARYAPGEPDFR